MTTAYTDFAYYRDTYLGTAIAEAQFPALALRASAYIDQITFQRAAAENDTDTVDLIKMATCSVAEEIQKTQESGDTGGIVSESVGSHSVTYAENSSARRSIEQKLLTAAALYLGGTGLLYRGF
jgi:hypothetical protein